VKMLALEHVTQPSRDLLTITASCSLLIVPHCVKTVTASRGLLIVSHCLNTVTASRGFCVAAPTIWNNLPDFIKVADYFNVFKRRLQCHLFDTAFQNHLLKPASLSHSLTRSKLRGLKSINLYCIIL